VLPPGDDRRDAPPPKKKCCSLDPFAVLKRNLSEARSPRVHRFMESPYGKNLRAGGSYAHALSWQTSRESTVVGACCGIGTGIDKPRESARGLGGKPSGGATHCP